jgi:hypothetical protein
MPAVQTQKQKANGKKNQLPDVIEQLEQSLEDLRRGRVKRVL